MGGEYSKFQQILTYYLFQKKIKNNIDNNNSIDGSKRGKGYFIHPEWIQDWKKMMGYESISAGLDNLNITTSKLSENQIMSINNYMTQNNIFLEVDVSFLVKKENFVLMNEMPITEKLLENLVDKETFNRLNLNKGTKYEELEYIFKKQMIIFIFNSHKRIKMLVHSLLPFSMINNLICLTFNYTNEEKFTQFVSILTTNNSTNIINFLLSVNIFNNHNYTGKDEFNDKIFTLIYEEVGNISSKDIKNNTNKFQLNENMLNRTYNPGYNRDKLNLSYNMNNMNNNSSNNNNNKYLNNFNNNLNNNYNNNYYNNNQNNINYSNNNQNNINYSNNNQNNINYNNNNQNSNFYMNNMNNNFNNNNNFLNNTISQFNNNYQNTNNNFNNNQNLNTSGIFNNNINNFNNNNEINYNENAQNKIKELEKLLNQEKAKNNELSLMNENLKNEIKQKAIQENKLNTIINNLKDENMTLKLKTNEKTLHNVSPDEKIFAIHFVSYDQKINRSIACKESNIFVHIEEKLYEEYPELKMTDNYFMVSGRKIKRFLSIKENDIRDGDNIVVDFVGDQMLNDNGGI